MSRPLLQSATSVLSVVALVAVGGTLGLTQGPADVRAVSAAPAARTAATAPVTPAAPRITRTVTGERRLTVAWRPASRGRSHVTGYRVSWTRLGAHPQRRSRTLQPLRLSITMRALASTSRYRVSVAALSGARRGPAATVTLTPRRLATRSPALAASTPSAPPITSSSVGSGTATVSWAAPSSSGTSAVTGYRVARDGTDTDGKGAWSTVVPASTRTFTMTLLRNDVPYTITVQALNAAGAGTSSQVRLTPTARPGAPVITSSSTGSGTMTASWVAPGSSGSSPITGYRVARDGTDTDGKGAWSTVVPASTRTYTMTLLRNGTTYTFSVSAINGSGEGPAATVRLTPNGSTTPTPPPPAGPKPVVVQSAVGQSATLRQGGPTGPRMRMAGVSVWGVPDIITAGGDFGLKQYAQRDAIAAAARAWGANHLRLRVLADDYNNDRQGLSKAQRLQMITGWRDAAAKAGLYLYVTWWDSLDGYAQDGGWPTRYRSAFAMMTDVHRAIGNDPRVFYEPFNEPNSFGDQWNAWSTAMRDTVAHWRSIGYTGILLIDTPQWSHAYNDASMTALERYDAGLPGMGGKHQLVFAKHDYANEGWPNGGDSFDPAKWRHETGGTQQHHLIWETEYGNYNGDPSSVHLSWSQQASRFFADELGNPGRPNYVGATAFVWGPWWDANALTDATNSTPTAWGSAVRDGLLARAAATRF
ncbi:MAG TPA: fibronectin type III domain-containing protein [Nocardioidaceae bacterium]|nr:fibronectin type III domain-containing protein [Nocardioidaceae bacterium]